MKGEKGMESLRGIKGRRRRKGRLGRKQYVSFFAFLFPSLLGVSSFVLLPFADVVRRSFRVMATDSFAGLSNYEKVFANEAFRLAVKNTARFTAVCIPLLIVLGLAAALLMAELPWVQLLKSCFLFPMAMPTATVVLVWKMIFSEGGFVNLLLDERVDYMATDMSFWVLVISYIWKNLGYTVVLWLAGIWGIPGDVIEAARVDGAGRLRIIRSVILPQLGGVLYTITVLSFLNSFKVFREAYLVSGPYPQESIYLLQHLFNNWFARLELDKMAAAAVCVAAALLAVIWGLDRLWKGEEG